MLRLKTVIFKSIFPKKVATKEVWPCWNKMGGKFVLGQQECAIQAEFPSQSNKLGPLVTHLNGCILWLVYYHYTRTFPSK